MPEQEEHEKIENMVESPHQKVRPARTLEDEVDSNATLEGFYAMNNIKPPKEVVEEIEKEAQNNEEDSK